ncbi:hypothetical protein NDU88_006414 [Pleurodeles waltl]|uniref:Uncharacterized protein n=1 Tax=Pleurodeles waltl TaxID=8319 RepID=A0AAV7RQ62_PLEWA|nr:hypothetical protein NDU88_006414 [Pleurodeles waltl]
MLSFMSTYETVLFFIGRQIYAPWKILRSDDNSVRLVLAAAAGGLSQEQQEEEDLQICFSRSLSREARVWCQLRQQEGCPAAGGGGPLNLFFALPLAGSARLVSAAAAGGLSQQQEEEDLQIFFGRSRLREAHVWCQLRRQEGCPSSRRRTFKFVFRTEAGPGPPSETCDPGGPEKLVPK